MSDIEDEKMDMTPRYVPETILTLKGGRTPIIRTIIHTKGSRPPGSPIGSNYATLECQTAFGSRWFGITNGWINSELKMVIVGTNPRDEVRMKWEVCTTP